MVNLIGLANHLREEFPIPANYQPIFKAMKKWLGSKPSDEVQLDCYRALIRLWERAGWVFDDNVGAVCANDDEEIAFDEDSITITSINGNAVFSFSLARGERHDRVIWF
jgi:hypothetical protein